ncbi:hypothetical protein PUN28_005690 [Cardiocondyla obscurior]|uniref:Ribosomal protein S11 n=1 Tax=Cardiocondyla obscurior TaxID=286306 RepID=A0AAW2GAN4_9HYME
MTFINVDKTANKLNCHFNEENYTGGACRSTGGQTRNKKDEFSSILYILISGGSLEQSCLINQSYSNSILFFFFFFFFFSFSLIIRRIDAYGIARKRENGCRKRARIEKARDAVIRRILSHPRYLIAGADRRALPRQIAHPIDVAPLLPTINDVSAPSFRHMYPQKKKKKKKEKNLIDSIPGDVAKLTSVKNAARNSTPNVPVRENSSRTHSNCRSVPIRHRCLRSKRIRSRLREERSVFRRSISISQSHHVRNISTRKGIKKKKRKRKKKKREIKKRKENHTSLLDFDSIYSETPQVLRRSPLTLGSRNFISRLQRKKIYILRSVIYKRAIIARLICTSFHLSKTIILTTKGLTVNDSARDGYIELRNFPPGICFKSVSQSRLSSITRRLPRRHK